MVDDFNSTVVRLKPYGEMSQGTLTSQFQFHCGSIKTHRRMKNVDAGGTISIPLWFD